MTRKNKVLIFSSLLVLVAAGAVGWRIWRERGGQVDKWLGFAPQRLGQSTERFCFNGVCLEKKEGSWLALEAGFEIPAEEEVVEVTVLRMEEIVLNKVVAENKDRFAGLGIGESGAIFLEAGGKKLELGTISQKYDGTYVREENGDVVYKIGVVLDRGALVDVRYWQKKLLTNLPRLQIKKVTIEKDGEKKELEDDGEMFEAVSSIKLGQYLADFEATGDEYKFEVSTEGETVEFFVGVVSEEKKLIYWGSQKKKYFFEMEKEIFEQLTKVFG